MKATIIKSVACVLVCTALFSFSAPSKPGGEGYEVYLNNKLVVQQYGSKMSDVQSITLAPSALSSQLTVRYHHCGRAGKARTIVVKNEKNTAVKTWNYGDASKPDALMACNVKELFALHKNNSGSLGLYYSASELPQGRLIVKIDISNKDVTSK